MKKIGVLEENKVRLTTALFNEVEVNHRREDVGKKFRFFNWWVVLRDIPKFDHSNPSITTTTEGSDREDEGDGVATESSTTLEQAERNGIADKSFNNRKIKKRPVGRQTAKVQAAAEYIRKTKLKLAESALRLQE